MSVLEMVLREEFDRLQSNLSLLKNKLDSLPRGTIYISKVYNSSFVYRKRKENSKVVCEYIGTFDNPESKEAIEKAEEYKRIKKMISDGKKELQKIRKALKAYDNKWKSFERYSKIIRPRWNP